MDWQRIRDDILNKLDMAEGQLSDDDYQNLLGDLSSEIESRIEACD